MRYLATEQPNILGIFETGNTVTISIYDIVSGNSETLSSNICVEIGTTGVFKWSTSNLQTQPTGKTELLWIMDNSSEKKYGKIMLDGYIENIDAKVSETAKETTAQAIKTKTDSLENYDDTIAQSKLDTIQTDLDNPNQYKADVSNLSTFNPTTDKVDVGKVNGTAVNGVDDFKGDGMTEATLHTALDSYTNKDDWKATIQGLTAQEVWEYATRTLTVSTGIDQATITQIAEEVEAHLLDETDGKKIIEAIVNAIGNQNIDEVALVASIRADIERDNGILKGVKSQTDKIQPEIIDKKDEYKATLDPTDVANAILNAEVCDDA